MEKKAPTSRQCTSLPSSRHHSTENLTTIGNPNSKSTPHTPVASQSASLADITAHASLVHETLESSLIFSDSTVSLNSFEMNDGSELRLRHLKINATDKENERPSSRNELLNINRRRPSLQECVNYNFLDLPPKSS
jgi:hypothetical protein